MKFICLATTVLLLSLASCTTFRLDPQAKDGVTVRQDRGQGTALVGEVLALEAQAQWGADVKFVLKVTNKSAKTLHLDGDQFKLFVGDGDRWTAVRVVPSDEVYSRAQKFLVAGTVLMAVGAVAFSEPDRVRTADTTSATVINTGGGNSVVVVQNQRRTYVDEGNTAQNVAAVGRFAKAGGDQLADLKDNLFYSVDLEAGKSYNGWIFGETGRGDYYKLVVPVEGGDDVVIFKKVKTRL